MKEDNVVDKEEVEVEVKREQHDTGTTRFTNGDASSGSNMGTQKTERFT